MSEIGFLVDYQTQWSVAGRLQGIVVYHFLMGRLIGFFIRDSVSGAYYAGRIISFLLFMGSLFIFYLTFLKLRAFKKIEIPPLLLGFLFVLFLPQFLISSVSVHPDALSIFLGALFFFAAYPLLLGQQKILRFLFLIFAAGAGFLTDRSTFFLVLMTLLVPFFLLQRKEYKKNVVFGLAFVVLFLMLGSVLIQIFPLQVENSFNRIKGAAERGVPAIPRLFSFDALSRQFMLTATDSFFFRFGWLAFGAGRGIYYAWRLFVLLAGGGLIIYGGKFIFSRLKKSLTDFGSSGELKLLLFSGIAVSIQLCGLWIFYGINGSLAQGRHLFPLILPLSLLFTVGLKNFFDLFHRKGGLAILSVFVLFEFLFFGFAVWNYIVPVFHLTVQGPHAGI